MANNTAKKQRNVAIELWRFLISVAITGFHVGWIIAMSCQGQYGYWMERSNWFFGSSEVLLIFTVTAGYFMVAHFKSRSGKDPEYALRSAASRAWDYTWTRIKSLLPVLILGYLLGVIISTPFFYPEYTVQDYLSMILNSIWEFLGFHAAGLRSTGNQFFNLNGTLWFISAMIIIGYFLYWLLCKSEDTFSGFIAPAFTIFLTGWWAFTNTRAAQTAWSTFGAQTASTNGMGGGASDVTATIGFNNGTIFVMDGMLIGVLLYYAIAKLSERELKSGAKIALTCLNLFVSVLLLWYVIYQPTYFNLQRWTVAFLCILEIGLCLLNRDHLTKLLNNAATNKFFAFLGSISLYVYMLHYPIAILVLRILGKNSEASIYSFWQVFLPTVAASLVLSVLTKFAMEKTILKKK